MKWQRVLLMLTLANLVILTFNLVELRAVARSVPRVLRGRALEIVDAQGRARATLDIQRAGKGHSEIVLFRHINER